MTCELSNNSSFTLTVSDYTAAAAKKAAAEAKKAEKAAPAPAPVVEEKKAEPAPAPAPKPAPVAAAPSGGALGSVKGEAQGGKKLEAETVSADTLEFLKKYQ